ncbi:ankyrin repeat domain-containing protein [Winogradskyella sp.]|uniref:ankyrin repeat domain-containing protein n=1 Tax=Winogradskyella sp. TaxID=1883156 RepID=UPI003BAD5F2A
MILLLLKTSIVIAVVIAFYKLVIEKESFYATNRLYLIIGLALTFALPFIVLPKLIQNQGILTNIIAPNDTATSMVNSQPIQTPSDTQTLNLEDSETVIDTSEEQTVSGTGSVMSKERSISDWLLIIYGFGVIVLSINLIAQILNLIFKIYRSQDRIKDTDAIIINSTHIKEPCSFFNYIFINPEQYEFDIYEQIIAHEKIHVKKWHSIDLLLSEIAVILLWFNPFAWLFRREVEKNIEYQTDSLLIGTHHTEKDDYQMNLLKIATYGKPLAITTNYNQSLIKQRILKMNTKKSNPHSYWKYAFTMPLFFVLLLALNKPYVSYAAEPSNFDGPELDDLVTEPNYFSDCEAFKKALEEKDIDKLKDMLIHLDPACVAYIENTGKNTLSSVKRQLEAGAELEVDTRGNLVLTDENGETSENIDHIQSVLSADANPECKVLLEAIRANDIAKVKALVATADVNCIDPNPGYDTSANDGNYWRYQKAKSPLFAVARTGNLEIAKVLVANGADVKLVVQGDGTPLIEAASYGRLELVKFFVSKGADVSRSFPNQGNALIAASRDGHLNVMKYLVAQGVDINHYSPNQGNALIAAANSSNVKAVKFLVEQGMDINFISPNQGNALIAASNNGRLENVKYLLTKGAEINKISPNQGTPLIAASNNGHRETVVYLIAKGAEIDKIAPNQGTPLIAASNNGHLETIKLLIEKGADINKYSPNQGTAINAASRNGYEAALKYLINQGADLNKGTDSHGPPLVSAAQNGNNDIIKQLLSQGADINAQTNGQGSALNAAARNGLIDTVKLLLNKGADVNLQNDGQGSALNAAARNGHNDVILYLLNQGADINLQNDGQGSALNAAARNGLMETVKLLVEKGADVNLYSDGQGSALSAASQNGHQDIVDYLKSKGAKPTDSNN